MDGADDRHVHDQRARRAGDVAADDARARLGGEREEPVDQLVEVGEREIRRQHERQRREPRRCTHRGQIAEVHRERAMADRARGHEAAIEVHAVDDRVGRDHLDRPRAGSYTAASSPTSTRSQSGEGPSRVANTLDQRVFTDVSDYRLRTTDFGLRIGRANARP